MHWLLLGYPRDTLCLGGDMNAKSRWVRCIWSWSWNHAILAAHTTNVYMYLYSISPWGSSVPELLAEATVEGSAKLRSTLYLATCSFGSNGSKVLRKCVTPEPFGLYSKSRYITLERLTGFFSKTPCHFLYFLVVFKLFYVSLRAIYRPKYAVFNIMSSH
jgi:hypothetical protein